MPHTRVTQLSRRSEQQGRGYVTGSKHQEYPTSFATCSFAIVWIEVSRAFLKTEFRYTSRLLVGVPRAQPHYLWLSFLRHAPS